MLRKIMAIVASTTIFMVVSFASFAIPAQAAGSCGAGSNSSFLKLIPTWHEYLDKDPGTCEISHFNIPGDLWKVGLAVVDIVLRFAGLIAMIFIIRAGFAYVLSRGNPTEAAKARQSIIDALIGVAIASIATLLVAFLGRTLTK